MIDQRFYIDDRFYSDISDFIYSQDNDHIIDEDGNLSSSIPDNWTQKVELTTLEPMFKLDADDIDHLVDAMIDRNEDRIGEYDNSDDVKKAILSGMDFDKINAAIPMLYYPNGTFDVLTKQDLIDCI